MRQYGMLILKYCRYALALISGATVLSGYLLGSFNILLCGVMALFLSNLCYCFENIRLRSLLLFFHMTIFVFLLTRPLISMLRGDMWWYFDRECVLFALQALFLTLLFLRLGAGIGECIFKKKHKEPAVPRPKGQYQINFQTSLQVVSLAFFALTMMFYLLLELEKLQFMQGRAYEELYIAFKSRYPSFFGTFSGMMKYALCLFLATLPSKRLAFVPLAVYFLSAAPSLLTGVRNPIVLNAIFVIVYYILRDAMEGGRKWLGKIEKACLILVAPVALVFLSAYNYIRDGQQVSMSAWESVVDLFYKQGVSFDVLCIGYGALPDLPDVVPKNYTFGPFVEYFAHGSVAQRFFGALDLGTQNSVTRAVYGSSFAHSMSYVAKDDYLEGHGWGSSYLLETFADWGYLGIIIASILFGMILILMMLALRKGILLRAITLVGLTSLYFVPRAETTGWISFVLTMQFWIAVGFCYVLAGLLARSTTCEGNRLSRQCSHRKVC